MAANLNTVVKHAHARVLKRIRGIFKRVYYAR